MKKIVRRGVTLLLGTSLFGATFAIAPTTSFAETQPYLTSAHVTQPVVTEQKQEFWIVTNEIKSPAKDGMPEIEAYRWDPGFLVVQKGQPVTLHFYGVKGKSHPFVIEGMNVKGDVQKGKVTTVTFTPQQAGTYPIICLVHKTLEAHGPMIAYLRVE